VSPAPVSASSSAGTLRLVTDTDDAGQAKPLQGLAASGKAVTSGSADLGPALGLTARGMAVTSGSASMGQIVGLSAAGHAVSSGSATLTRHEFRDLSVAAGRAALARFEAKSAADPRDVFAETGEVLFWLYALGDTGDRKPNAMSPGLQWVRHCYAHGNLLTTIVDYQLVFVLDETPLDGAQEKREHLWSDRVLINSKARDSELQKALERKYRDEVATRPVLATLRDELNKLAGLTGSRA
jgi:hypothetical protein